MMNNELKRSPEIGEVEVFARDTVDNVERVIVGKHHIIKLVVIAMLCEGHLLIEDAPGTGKTMLARAMAITTGLDFKRVQCTPDLLPSDITGVSVFNQKTREFEFRPGPAFSHVLLADEINRATPRTQSALLEAMAEGQITVDGETYALRKPFLVLATQNPIEFEGTFPLPEAQLDRFLMRLSIGYPDQTDEDAMLQMQQLAHPIETLSQAVDGEQLPELQRRVRGVHVAKSVRQYVLDLVNTTRQHELLSLGASPRASLGVVRAAQALAATGGRDYVIPDDVKHVAPSCLAHRMAMNPEHALSGETTLGVVRALLRDLPVPLSV